MVDGVKTGLLTESQAALLWPALCAALPGYVSCIDRQRRVLFLSRTLSRDLSRVLGQPMETFVVPEAREGTIARVEAAFSTGREQRLDFAVNLRDGTTLSLVARVLPFVRPDGQDFALLLTNESTDRQSLEEELERSKEFQRLVIDHLPDFVVLVDRERRFVWTNRIAPGLTAADVIGAPVDKFTTPETHAVMREVVRAAFEEGVSGHYEVEGYHDGKTNAWYLTRVVPVRLAGRIENVLMLTSDISERKRAEKALLEAEERLHRSQRLENIGQLAGGIAHDFNNLLQVISGNLQVAQEQIAGAGDAHEELQQAIRATERAAELTSHLLAIGRRKRMDARRVDLGPLVSRSIRMLRRAIPENVRLSFEEPTEPAFVELDAPQFEQVLINLCVNARDAMPDGGSLNVAIQTASASRVLLTVTDSGTGIAPENLPRIFEPFFSTKGAGSGLGLAVATGIVAAHGGTISAESDGRTGTTMKISLPRVEAAPEESIKPVAAAIAGRGGVILVAEDEPMVRAHIVRTLKRAGYSVLEAENGQRAVEIFRDNAARVDLILLDAIMPLLDGWNAYLQIAALRPGIKVLFATGYAADVLPPDFATSGARLLSKPFGNAALLAEVSELLQQRAAAAPKP